jgi:hypothetical protein
MPDEVEEFLSSFYTCKSRQETYSWDESTAHKIIALAKRITPEEGAYFSNRAYCPLCGRGSSSAFSHEAGFSVPEGLRRHLVGWGDRGNQCPVFGAAMSLARDYWHVKFHDQEVAEEAEKQARILERKKTEALYQIAPNEEPELIDERAGYSNSPRNAEEMAWAEERLSELGFQINSEGNVKSYISEMENFVVYADPRSNGEIRFTVYKKPLPKRRRRALWNRSFSLKDNWKHDLRGKYESRLAQATMK